MKGWVKVYKSGQVIECEMVKAMLLDNEVDAVVMNQVDSNFLFGQASVWVAEADEARAKELIKNNNGNTNE